MLSWFDLLLCACRTHTVTTGARFDVSRRGKKGLKFSRDQTDGTYRSGEGVGEPA